MAISKVLLNGTTLIDITDTTATTADVIAPKNFYGADGKKKTGVNVGGGGAIVLQDTDGSIILDDGTQNAALLQHKEVKQIDGVQTITPDTGFIGLSSVTVGFDKDADFCFWDYDGTPLYSFSFAEIAEMRELPPPPDHSQDEIPLTFQYWNWSLSDLKALDYPMDVGAVYYPTDGKMHWTYKLDNITGLTCSFTTTYTNSITIDWGDGSEPELWGSNEVNGANPTHTYAQAGTYHCSWEGVGRPSSAMRTEGNHALVGTFYVSEEQNDAWLSTYWSGTLSNSCVEYIVGFTRDLASAKTLWNLKAFVGGKYFKDGVEILSQTPQLKLVSFGKRDTQDAMGDYCFSNSALPRLRIDKSATWKRFAFQNDRNIEFFNLPTGYNCCQNCYNLRRVVIVGEVASGAFEGCRLQEIWCGLNTPPVLNSANSFNNILSSCKIHVKASALSAYQEATNWSTYASHMVGDWDGNPDR